MKITEAFDLHTDVRRIFEIGQIVFVKDWYSGEINPYYVDENHNWLMELTDKIFCEKKLCNGTLPSDVIAKLLQNNGLKKEGTYLTLANESKYKEVVTAPLYIKSGGMPIKFYYIGEHTSDTISPKGYKKLGKRKLQFVQRAFDILFGMKTVDNGKSAIIGKWLYGLDPEKYCFELINQHEAIVLEKEKCKETPVITVPKEYASMVIGRNGKRIKKLAQKIGVKFIKVKTV